MGVSRYRLPSGASKFRVKFVMDGQTHKRRGFVSRADAVQWEASERSRLNTPPPALGPELASFASCVLAYLKDCEARMQLNTVRSKAKHFDDLAEWLGTDSAPLPSITKLQFATYLVELQRKRGSSAANRALKEVKALFNWCHRTDMIHQNTVHSIRPFPEAHPSKYVPPPEDVEAVILAAGPDWADLITVLYHTGARIGEIRALTWEDVNLEKRSITLRTRKRRGGELEADHMAMGETLFVVMSRRWKNRNKDSQHVFCRSDGSPLPKDGTLRNLMERACKRAGVSPFGFHGIRHHVASVLADSGKATLGQVQRFLRHRRAATTERYLHEITRDQREVAEILDQERGKNG